MSGDPAWDGFPLRWIELRRDSGFRITDVTSRVGSELGPVLFFRQAKSRPRAETQERLKDRTVTSITDPEDKTALLSDLGALRARFASGEPLLPRRLVAVILIVRKLYSGQYWGGSHEKNFIWSDAIANGRGVDPSFKDIAQTVANFLRGEGVLVPKWGGRTGRARKRQKYALNRERRTDIERLVDGVYDKSIRRWVYADKATVSARRLDGWRRSPSPSGE